MSLLITHKIGSENPACRTDSKQLGGSLKETTSIQWRFVEEMRLGAASQRNLIIVIYNLVVYSFLYLVGVNN